MATFEIAGCVVATNTIEPMTPKLGKIFENIFRYCDAEALLPNCNDNFAPKGDVRVSKYYFLLYKFHVKGMYCLESRKQVEVLKT